MCNALAWRLHERFYPSKEVLHDIDKLRRVEFECERYVLPFFTYLHQVPRHEHDVAMPYIDGIRKHGVIDKSSINDGFGRFMKATGNLSVLGHGEIQAGKAFDVDVSVFYWLMAIAI